MKEERGGHIVVMSSLVGVTATAFPFSASYVGAKHALHVGIIYTSFLQPLTEVIHKLMDCWI
jgi:short-subunit dehydrogenase